MKTFGQHVRELRRRTKLSLREFARQLGGISAAFLSDIELGRRYPSDRVLASMAKILHVDLHELKAYDTRAPVGDIRRLAESNPAYGVALRQVIESGVSAEELMKLAAQRRTRRKRTK